MKYNIYINQLALQELTPQLDLKDGAILDYLIGFCAADNKNIDQLDNKEEGINYRYTWINYKHLLQEMPLLKFTHISTLTARLKKIKKAGFIKTKILSSEKNGSRKVYIRLTEKIEKLFFTENNIPIDLDK